MRQDAAQGLGPSNSPRLALTFHHKRLRRPRGRSLFVDCSKLALSTRWCAALADAALQRGSIYGPCSLHYPPKDAFTACLVPILPWLRCRRTRALLPRSGPSGASSSAAWTLRSCLSSLLMTCLTTFTLVLGASAFWTLPVGSLCHCHRLATVTCDCRQPRFDWRGVAAHLLQASDRM